MPLKSWIFSGFFFFSQNFTLKGLPKFVNWICADKTVWKKNRGKGNLNRINETLKQKQKKDYHWKVSHKHPTRTKTSTQNLQNKIHWMVVLSVHQKAYDQPMGLTSCKIKQAFKKDKTPPLSPGTGVLYTWGNAETQLKTSTNYVQTTNYD